MRKAPHACECPAPVVAKNKDLAETHTRYPTSVRPMGEVFLLIFLQKKKIPRIGHRPPHAVEGAPNHAAFGACPGLSSQNRVVTVRPAHCVKHMWFFRMRRLTARHVT